MKLQLPYYFVIEWVGMSEIRKVCPAPPGSSRKYNPLA